MAEARDSFSVRLKLTARAHKPVAVFDPCVKVRGWPVGHECRRQGTRVEHGQKWAGAGVEGENGPNWWLWGPTVGFLFPFSGFIFPFVPFFLSFFFNSNLNLNLVMSSSFELITQIQYV